MEEGGRLDGSGGQGSCCPNSKLIHLVLKAPVGTRGEYLKMGLGRIFWKGRGKKVGTDCPKGEGKWTW